MKITVEDGVIIFDGEDKTFIEFCEQENKQLNLEVLFKELIEKLNLKVHVCNFHFSVTAKGSNKKAYYSNKRLKSRRKRLAKKKHNNI